MRLCPICSLVSGTWIALLVYRAAGHAVDSSLIATLMGGSAVGITYLLERRLPTGRQRMWFKLLVVPPLLAAAYGVASQQWPLALIAAAAGVVIMVAFGVYSSPVNKAVAREAEKRLEQCC